MLIKMVASCHFDNYSNIDERIKSIVEHECNNRRFQVGKLMQELEDLGITRNKKRRVVENGNV